MCLLDFNDFFDFLKCYNPSFLLLVYLYVTNTFFIPEFWNGIMFFDELRFFFNFVALFYRERYLELEFDFDLNLLSLFGFNKSNAFRFYN